MKKQIILPGITTFSNNASILRHNNQWHMIVRVGWGNSRIHLARLTDTFDLIDHKPIITKKPEGSGGCEDPRAFFFDGNWWVQYSVYTMNYNKCHLEWCKLDGDLNASTEYKLEFPDQNRLEKNWIPFDNNGKLQAINTFREPHTRLMVFDGERVHKLPELHPPLTWDYGLLSGGSAAVSNSGEHYALVHSYRVKQRAHNDYFVGMVVFRTDPFRVIRWTPQPFWNEGDIIYPCGLALHNDEWVVSYGKNDLETWVTTFRREDVEKLLVPV